MLTPLIRRPRSNAAPRSRRKEKERGFTMALVAVAMVSIIAMAALSIDIGTLYEAKAEAQRSADAAAVAAARTISISGITGDPGNLSSSWRPICGGATGLATLTAIQVAQQNLIAGIAVPSGQVTVTYGAGPAGASSPTCVGAANFGVNPIVMVKVQRTNLPIFFARVFSLFGSKFSNTGVSATASAEVYNPSGSGTVGPGMVPVTPRCVKPWIVPNIDPTLGAGSPPFVSVLDGSISRQGISPAGIIGATFNLVSDCIPGAANCLVVGTGIIANPPTSGGGIIHYVPALVTSNSGAVPSCFAGDDFSKAIVGCDQSTVYACGTPLGANADFNENPVNPTAATGDTSTAIQCLTNSGAGGADNLTTAFPYQIRAGFGNPLVQKDLGRVNTDDVITTSNSIVTLPIYDNGVGAALAPPPTPPVTIVGFLQVFINSVDPTGNINVTVLNVAGCSNTAAGNPTASGTSPVPVRLITPP
jgi:Flp pilus assembly protein TadG